MSIEGIDRLQHIEAKIKKNGRVKVVDLAQELDVSEMTIRRDLEVLAEQGIVQRVHGGATASGPQPFGARFSQNSRAKERIATKLAELVEDGSLIGMDASTTLQRLAPLLRSSSNLTVITNGPETFESLRGCPNVTALLTGGRLDPRTGSLVGPLATRAARDINVRRLFVSAAAIDPEFGTSEPTLEEVDVKIALAEAAEEVVVAVDATKLGQREAARCFPPGRVGIMVTELEPKDHRLDPYRDAWVIR